MTTKHTPGPWTLRVDPELTGSPYIIVQRGMSGGNVVADDDPDRALADARLMVAAPDMLAALRVAERRIMELCQTVCLLSGNPRKVRADDYAEEIRAAIAKATGQG